MLLSPQDIKNLKSLKKNTLNLSDNDVLKFYQEIVKYDNVSKYLTPQLAELLVKVGDGKTQVLSRLSGWSKESLNALSTDLKSNAKFAEAFIDGLKTKPELVESWKYISDIKTSGKSKLTQDIDLMKVVQRQRNNGIVDKIGSNKYDDIIKNYAGQCKGCDAPAYNSTESVKHLPPHDEMLDNLETFVNKHYGKDGVTKVLDDLKSSDPRKQKGAEFVSRILKDQDDVSAFEFKYLDDYDNTADFVLNGKNIDGKSWAVSGSIDKIGGWEFPKQLKDYLNNGSFEQWFDYSRFQKSTNATYSSMTKTDATKHIKEQYQKLFSKNNYAAYKKLRESNWLKNNDIIEESDFIEAVNDISDDFYSFIKVK